MKFTGTNNEILQLSEVDGNSCHELTEVVPTALSVLWFTSDDNQLLIDDVLYTFHRNDVVCLTEFHNVETRRVHSVNLLRFNRAFFCIFDHDADVGCKGLLFFGAAEAPRFRFPDDEVTRVELFWQTFVYEMDASDDLQLQMLQMMLKRYLILCTRFFREQHQMGDTDRSQVDLIRSFNYLVEQHFKTLHTVADYAELMHKSPKTLSNLFSKVGGKTPLQYIQERKMLEARRWLHHTDKSIKEVAYDLGFEDLQSFSRFFKKHQGVSPTQFKASV